MSQIDGCLERLQTKFIDLFYIHIVDTSVDVDRVVMTFRDAIASGKINHWGLSNFAGYQIAKILAACDRLGCPRPICVQAQYSLLCRSTEWEVAKVCDEEGLTLIPWSPLASGLLSGKYSRPGSDASDKGDAEGRLHTMMKEGLELPALPGLGKVDKDHFIWDVIEESKKIADAHETSIAGVALRWILDQKHAGVASVLIGATKMAHLEANMQAGVSSSTGGFKLSSEELGALDKASTIEAPYPYGMLPMGVRHLDE